VIAEATLNWYVNENNFRFKNLPIPIDETAVECAMLKSSKIKAEKIYEVIHRIKEKGIIDRILHRYYAK